MAYFKPDFWSTCMLDLSRPQIEKKLAEYKDPYFQQGLYAANVIKQIEIDQESVKIEVVFGFPFAGKEQLFIEDLQTLLQPLMPHHKIRIELSYKIESHVGQKGMKGLPQIKNIIAIASGKGGVGKSTTAVNLALALAKEGARVGILDADIHGPSQPTMLGVKERPVIKDKKTLLPIEQHGIQSMSIGYLIDPHSPMVWRGPMVSMALQQLLNDTHWDSLDYLVIDLPPGTGDIQLTLAQKIPVSGAVIVTTPQDLALLDARRAIEMFKKVNVPILGVIENMSTHICTHCGHEERIFSQGGGKYLADEYHVNLLGALPLDIKIREQTDGGMPPVISDPEGLYASLYREIARQIAAKISLQPKDYSARFPSIMVER
jgi:ATP-binding protein involved in chromosome partitioning